MMILKIHQFLMMQWQQQQQSKQNLAQCLVVITLNPIHVQHVQACFSQKNISEFCCDLSKPSSSSACSSFCKNISHFRYVLWERKGNTDTDGQTDRQTDSFQYLARIPCTRTTRWSGRTLSCCALSNWGWITGTKVLLLILELPLFILFESLFSLLLLPSPTAISTTTTKEEEEEIHWREFH